MIDHELLVVESCVLVGPSAFRTLLLTDEPINPSSTEAVVEPITFFPDGTMDDAVLVFRATDDSDDRRVLIETAGVTGTVRKRIFTRTEWEAYNEQREDDMAMR